MILSPTSEKTAVLLVNLGTPEHLTAAGIRQFLSPFLWDRRVVDFPRPLWWCLLNGFILPFRTFKLLTAYRRIWSSEGSPLRVHTQKLAQRLHEDLSLYYGKNISVWSAMTYGTPSLSEAITRIIKNKITKLIILPLFPQYSDATTAAAFDAISRECGKQCQLPSLIFIREYSQALAYQMGVAQHIQSFWSEKGSQNHLLFSFHGLPTSQTFSANDYRTQCVNTASGIANLLKIPENSWSVGFQSRFGKKEWIKPYTDETLLGLAQQGLKCVDVVCPGFATDCLETLEELDILNHKNFLKAGGRSFRYIPAMNSSPIHVQVLSDILKKYIVIESI